jgi:hypothetical protein
MGRWTDVSGAACGDWICPGVSIYSRDISGLYLFSRNGMYEESLFEWGIREVE